MSLQNAETQEELSKKSYEVVLPLDKNVSLMSSANASGDGYASDESVEDDKDGRPVCNIWNGKNYELHVLGHTDNPFLKHLKSFQIPETIKVEFDPFSRSDVDLKGEHPVTDSFVVWSAKEREQSTALEASSSDESITKCYYEALKISLSDSEDDAEDKNKLTYDVEESDTEIEIYEYIKSLKEQKRNGTNRTGETLWYCEDQQTIRNLHKESISITNYGKLKNQSQFGNREFLFDELSPDEKRMLMDNDEQK